MAAEPPDAADVELEQLPAACLQQVLELPPPQIGGGALAHTLRPEPGSVVVLRLEFRSATQPPFVTVLFDSGAPALVRWAREHAGQYRLPCASDSHPVVAHRTFRFLDETSAPSRATAELQFGDLLRLVDLQRSGHGRFDTTAMGCPFKLAFAPYQPYAPNTARETGERNGQRQPLLEWLRSASLNLAPEAMRQLIGQPLQVAVPCVVLDLS